MKQEMLEHPEGLDAEASEFYGGVMNTLREAGIPFLVGGGFAYSTYTGIVRDTKDLDLFVLPSDITRILKILTDAGYETVNKYPHWLAKVYSGSRLVDLIFSSGNGVCPVDQDWFDTGIQATVIGQVVQLMGVEEMIWQKAFIMERHRFDGADIIHLLHARRETLKWDRLVERFGDKWMVLFSHLLLYRFVYQDDRSPGCQATMRTLAKRLGEDLEHVNSPDSSWPQTDQAPLCRGTLLSLLEYLPDINVGGFRDARLLPDGSMSAAEVEHWTNTFER